MIRTAYDRDFCRPITDETMVRLYGLREAYGLDVPFIRYYADEEGGLLSLMDGIAMFSPASDAVTEEWIAFLQMMPDVRCIHCSGRVGEALVSRISGHLRTGVVLKLALAVPCVTTESKIVRDPYLPKVYSLLSRCFDTLPALDAWYPDVSHRVRHGCCMLACIEEEDRIVSTAMTVAQAGDYAVLGQVATDPDYRRRGYAYACLSDLISRWQGDRLYIVPANEVARKLYEALGFSQNDTWAELEL